MRECFLHISVVCVPVRGGGGGGGGVFLAESGVHSSSSYPAVQSGDLAGPCVSAHLHLQAVIVMYCPGCLPALSHSLTHSVVADKKKKNEKQKNHKSPQSWQLGDFATHIIIIIIICLSPGSFVEK